MRFKYKRFIPGYSAESKHSLFDFSIERKVNSTFSVAWLPLFSLQNKARLLKCFLLSLERDAGLQILPPSPHPPQGFRGWGDMRYQSKGVSSSLRTYTKGSAFFQAPNQGQVPPRPLPSSSVGVTPGEVHVKALGLDHCWGTVGPDAGLGRVVQQFHFDGPLRISGKSHQ